MPSTLRKFHFEQLEARRLLTGMAEGQLFLYLLNEARHDPAAYARTEALPVSFDTVQARQPLAINANLQRAAQFHSVEMAEHNYFAHQSAVTGRWPNANARAHGYALPSWWTDDNNFIESIAAGNATARASLRQLMMSPPHRDHLLGISNFNSQNADGGIGYAFDGSALYRNYWTVHLARTEPSQIFLTGVVYDDLNDNGRYDLNEGLSAMKVSHAGSEVLTNSAGGWSLVVQANQSYPLIVETAAGTLRVDVDVASTNRHVEFRTDVGMSRIDFGNWQVVSDRTPPSASLSASDLRFRNRAEHLFTVSFRDNGAIASDSIATGNFAVNGPNGFQQTPVLVSKTQSGEQWKAVYRVTPPGPVWTSEHNGTYAINVVGNQVRDISGNPLPAAMLGSFQVGISSVVHREDVNDDGIVSPLDVVQVINHLNLVATSAVHPGFRPELDVNRDGSNGPIDVILIINYLNRQITGGGEGEGSRAAIGTTAISSAPSFYAATCERGYTEQTPAAFRRDQALVDIWREPDEADPTGRPKWSSGKIHYGGRGDLRPDPLSAGRSELVPRERL